MTTPTITASFNVGHRYRCTLSTPATLAPDATEIIAEWEPHVPRAMSAVEWHDYTVGRDDFMRKLSAAVGGTVGVVDL